MTRLNGFLSLLAGLVVLPLLALLFAGILIEERLTTNR